MDDRRLRPLNWVGGSFRDYVRFTPKSDIDLVRRRLGMAEKDYRGRHGAADDKAKGR